MYYNSISPCIITAEAEAINLKLVSYTLFASDLRLKPLSEALSTLLIKEEERQNAGEKLSSDIALKEESNTENSSVLGNPIAV